MIKRDRGDPVRRDRRMSVGWTNGLEIGRRVFFFFIWNGDMLGESVDEKWDAHEQIERSLRYSSNYLSLNWD